MKIVEPAHWPKPKGYANGVVTSGPTLFIAGQIGWNLAHEFESDDLADQFAATLDNVLAVVKAAGLEPSSVVKMTIYVTDLPAYRASGKAIGAAWRERFGKHFPSMALVGVAGLVEPRAKVEIETTCEMDAVIPA